MPSGVVGATAITCLVSHSSRVLNTEHNGVLHRRVASTYSCEHAKARLPLIFTFPVFAKLALSAKSTWAQNETTVRIFIRIQLQKLTCFRKSLPYKSVFAERRRKH